LQVQLQLLDELISKITPEWIQAQVLDNLNLRLEKFERAWRGENGHEGVINPLYFLSASNQELVLRIANPHPFWKGKTTHETKLIAVAHSIGIPVPKVLAFTEEWILMEKVSNGITLTELLEKPLSSEQKFFVFTQVQTAISRLNKIGSQSVPCDRIMSFCGSPEAILFDGPRLAPCHTYEEFLRNCGNWALEIMDSDPVLKEMEAVAEVKPLLRNYLDGYLSKRCQKFNLSGPFVLCHLDVHPGNLLFERDTLKFNALLDWEHAKPTIYMDEKLGLRNFAEDLGCLEIFEFKDELELIEEFNQLKCSVLHCVWACFACITWWASERGEREKITSLESLQIENADKELKRAIVLLKKLSV